MDTDQFGGNLALGRIQLGPQTGEMQGDFRKSFSTEKPQLLCRKKAQKAQNTSGFTEFSRGRVFTQWVKHNHAAEPVLSILFCAPCAFLRLFHLRDLGSICVYLCPSVVNPFFNRMVSA
jgi:hypothetical protein